MTDGRTQQPDKRDAFNTTQTDPQDRATLEVIGQMQREIDRLSSELADWKTKAQYFYKEREEARAEVERLQPMIDSRFIKGEEEIRLMRKQREAVEAQHQAWIERNEAMQAYTTTATEGEARATPLSWRRLWRDFKCLVSLP